MKTIALIQARMSSSRFPGKVIEPIADLPAIVYLVRRARRAASLNEVAVATSTAASDDPLVEVLAAHDIPVFRGDLNDVLGRYAAAARHFEAGEIVRLTGDCPLVDPDIIDAVITARAAECADYSSNVDPPTFPDGLDCECFSREALTRADEHASTSGEREHVTLWMRSPENGLARANCASIVNAAHLRLTVDYPDDLLAVRRLVAVLPNSGDFDYFDILRALSANPDLLNLNKHERNEGMNPQY